MLSLIKYELDKILSKKIVIIGLVCLLFMNLMLYVNWAFPREGSMSIADSKSYAEKFNGELTNDKIENIYADLQSEPDYKYIDGNMAYNILISRFITDDDKLLTVEESFSDGYDSDVKNSLVWGYTEGCASTISVILSSMLIIGFIIVIAISPVYSDEYTSGMDSLILTSRFGKTKVIYAKMAASIIFGLSLALFSIIMLTVLFTINYGFTGWEASVQLSAEGILDSVPYVLSFGKAYLIMCAVWIIAEISLAAFTSLISSVSKSSFISLLISSLVYIVPFICANYLVKIGIPIELVNVANLLSIQPGLTLVNSQNMYLIIILADIVITTASFFISKYFFRNHQVR